MRCPAHGREGWPGLAHIGSCLQKPPQRQSREMKIARLPRHALPQGAGYAIFRWDQSAHFPVVARWDRFPLPLRSALCQRAICGTIVIPRIRGGETNFRQRVHECTRGGARPPGGKVRIGVLGSGVGRQNALARYGAPCSPTDAGCVCYTKPRPGRCQRPIW